MQYQSSLNRDQLIKLATKTYFGNVDAKNLDAVLGCFHNNAIMTVQTSFTVHDGKDAIREMFTRFMADYETILHRDFVCTVDEKNGRICAGFVAELIDAEGTTTLLENINFWRIRDDQFQEVYIYMSGANVLL
jgi:ketosteroid isomerase-like protein